MEKINFKRNLVVATWGCFLSAASINLVMPFISFYVEELGAPKNRVELYTGLAISLTAISSAMVTPIWGRLADWKGRKVMMVRAAVITTFTMGLIAFVNNIFWLLFLRLLHGLFSGYTSNATTLIAMQASDSETEQDLGIIATGNLAGNLIGPVIGGFLADHFGIRNVFLITGGMLALNSVLTIFLVKENVQSVAKEEIISTKQLFKKIKHPHFIYILLFTTFIFNVGLNSISPIITLFVRQLVGHITNLSFVSGLIVSLSGISSMMFSPILGRLGDKIGSHRILSVNLIFMVIFLTLMGMIGNVWQLGTLRFMLGISSGAIIPAVNTLLTNLTPQEGISRVFSYNQMSTNFGRAIGPLIGSTVGKFLGYRSVFLVTACCVGIDFAVLTASFRKNIFNKN